MTLKKKFTLFTASTIILSVGITTLFTLYSMNKEFDRQAVKSLAGRINTLRELLAARGSGFSVQDGKLMAGSYVINGNYEIPDKIKELFGGTATIFMGDTRVSTNVIKPDGSRAVGTQLKGPAYDAVIGDGKPFHGDTKILGDTFIAAYDPIRDAGGKVIGALYVGVKKDEFFAEYYKTVWTALGATGLLVCLMGLLSWLLSDRSLRPLDHLLPMLKDISDGDLTKRVTVETHDEIGEVGHSFNNFADKIQGVILKLAADTAQVASATAQLQANTEQIVAGAQTTAEKVGNVANDSEEMAVTSSDIARNCELAAESSRLASKSAVAGADIVHASVEVMGRIADRVRSSAKTVENLGERSDHIGEIVRTIKDIADQTNLLALNAAIEAARAGEQGRGFAVVADEVRALAERTTKATKEVSEMIDAIQNETKQAVASMGEGVHEVEVGTSEAAHSGEALKDILAQIEEVTSQIGRIATAAEQQTATMANISENIQEITRTVNESAEGTRDSANATASLASLTQNLDGLVGYFKLVA
jgi:methyl-accepting chemotaxis protein